MAQRRRRRRMGGEINRSAELQLRVRGSAESFSSRINDIKDDGTIKFLSPMTGGRPRQLKAGTSVNIVQASLGGESHTSTIIAVGQLHDDELDEWIVIAQQPGEPEEWTIKQRAFAREVAAFPIEVRIAEQEDPTFDAICYDLSGSGIRFIVSLEKRDALKRDMEIELDFALPAISDDRGEVIEPSVRLPTLKGNIIRMYPQETIVGNNQWAAGVEFAPFEEDDKEIQDEILRSVLKLQIRNQARMD